MFDTVVIKNCNLLLLGGVISKKRYSKKEYKFVHPLGY